MVQHEFQYSCIVEFSTRPRFDSDGEPPLSLIRIVDCMVWPYCRSRRPSGNMAAVSHCRCLCWSGDGQNETQDGSQIEEPIKKDLRNTDYFKVISTELLELFIIIVRRPARRVGPSNLKSGGFDRSRGRAMLGTWVTVARITRTWMQPEQKGPRRTRGGTKRRPMEPVRPISTG